MQVFHIEIYINVACLHGCMGETIMVGNPNKLRIVHLHICRLRPARSFSMADTILKKHIKKNPFVRQKLYGLVSRTVYAYRPYLCRYQQKRNGDVFAVNIKSTAGFAANLEFCLEILLYCELHGMTPYLVLTGKNYLSKERGDDWFAYFFDNLQLSEDQKQRINENKVAISKIRTIQELGLPENYDIKLNLENAPKLVRKYIGIKKHILDEVDIFCENNFTNKFVLGIHFRGTDKDEGHELRFVPVYSFLNHPTHPSGVILFCPQELPNVITRLGDK